MKRAIALSLLLAALLLTASSCGSDPESVPETAGSEQLPVSETESAVVYPDNLPELDYGQAPVTFLYRAEVADEFYADTDNGDVVNDALNASIRSVEERLNVDIVLDARAGHLVEARDGYMNGVSNAVMAGDCTYDWVDLMIGNSPLRAQEGIFADLTQNAFLDLSQPWYIDQIAETVSVGDKLFFVSGDASLGYLKCAYCIYFNKDIAARYDLNGLYDEVLDGKWTMDRLKEVSAMTCADLNNDGKYEPGDQLGFVLHDQNHEKGFFRAMDLFVFTPDNQGNWVFSLGSERDHSVIRKIYSTKKETDGVYFFTGTNAVANQVDAYQKIASDFVSGTIFMISAEMDDAVSQFREMKSPYGILPFPKYDEAQDNYHTISRNTHNAFSMPITCADPDRAGAVLEALGSSNYEKVFPNYFDVAMKTKYASAPEDAALFDLIHNTMCLDFGYIYSNALNGVVDTLKGGINKPDNFASLVASLQKSITAKLDTYLQTVEKNYVEN